jgi:uncharacterized membrane protein YtjA (UPF0391 family)
MHLDLVGAAFRPVVAAGVLVGSDWLFLLRVDLAKGRSAIWLVPNRGRLRERGKNAMLKWALIFFVISLVAGFFGFSGLSAATAGIAKILFFIALAIFVIFLLLAIFAGQAIL